MAARFTTQRPAARLKIGAALFECQSLATLYREAVVRLESGYMELGEALRSAGMSPDGIEGAA